MLIGRFLFLLPLLAAAGSLAARSGCNAAAPCRRTAACSSGCIGTVVIVGALTFSRRSPSARSSSTSCAARASFSLVVPALTGTPWL